MSTVSCRFCRATTGDLVLDLGEQPGCESFPPLDDPAGDAVHPLRLWLCASCGLAQLADDGLLSEEPAGIEPTALAHQRTAAITAVAAAGLLPAGATVLEAASPHRGYWWPELAAHGLRRATPGEPADIVLDGAFGAMHARDQAAAVAALVQGLAPEGVLLFEFHSLAAVLRGQQWNTIRLGHYAYYSLPAVRNLLGQYGLTVTDAWLFPLYGGTVLVAARRGGVPSAAVTAMIADEIAAGVLDAAALQKLQEHVDISIDGLRRLTADAQEAGKRVYGYSAASRAVALVYLAGLGAGQLIGVADMATEKHGTRMPGTRIPVITPAELVAARPDIVLLFVSDLLPEVRRSLPEIEAAGGRWVDAGLGTVTSSNTVRS